MRIPNTNAKLPFKVVDLTICYVKYRNYHNLMTLISFVLSLIRLIMDVTKGSLVHLFVVTPIHTLLMNSLIQLFF